MAFFACAGLRSRCCRLFLENQLLLNARGLTATLTEIVQLVTTNIAATLDFDLGDTWAVQTERTLDAFPVRDLTVDKVSVQTTVAACYLDTLLGL